MKTDWRRDGNEQDVFDFGTGLFQGGKWKQWFFHHYGDKQDISSNPLCL